MPRKSHKNWSEPAPAAAAASSPEEIPAATFSGASAMTRNFGCLLEAAVDAPARPVGAAVSDPAAYCVYPLIILTVYIIVTGGIL